MSAHVPQSGAANGSSAGRGNLLRWLDQGLACLPERVKELNRQLGRTPIDLGALSQAIESDLGLARHLRQVCGIFAEQVEDRRPSLEDAVILLGPERLRSVAIGFWLQHCETLAPRWMEQALGFARVAERVARLSGYGMPERAYVAALLRDVALICLSGELQDGDGRSVDCERQLYGIDHCQFGRWLAEAWGFPADLVEVLEWQHQPGAGVADRHLLGVVVFAGKLAAAMTGVAPATAVGPDGALREWLSLCFPQLDKDARLHLIEALENDLVYIVPQRVTAAAMARGARQ